MPKDKNEKAKRVVIVEEVTPEKEIEEVTPVETKQKEVVPEKVSTEVPTEKEEEVNKVEEDKPNYLWIIIPTALLVGALVGGLITYFSGVSKLNKEEVTPSPISSEVPNVEATPEASPVGELKKDTLKIQILNGSGTSGAAGKAKTYLEGLGYSEVDTGNANSSDFSETEISIKDSSKDYLDMITSDLSKSYKVASDSTILVATSKYDVVITLGQK